MSNIEKKSELKGTCILDSLNWVLPWGKWNPLHLDACIDSINYYSSNDE
jgi:hypothetical protein